MSITKKGPLLPEEETHLKAFGEARPDWHVVVLNDRFVDEETSIEGHQYPAASPYQTGMKYVLERVIPHAPCKVLDIGSPVAQNIALSCTPGIDLTVADVRTHPDAALLGLKWEVMNGTALKFADKSFPIVVSCWVMGHIGDGRYGDPYDVDGDLRFIREIARVCSGFAVVGIGLIDDACVNIYNLHRSYSWMWLQKAFDECGLTIREAVNLPVKDDVYFGGSFVDHRTLLRRDGWYGICTAVPK